MKRLLVVFALFLGAAGLSAQTITDSDLTTKSPDAPRFRFALQGGASYLLAKTDKSMGDAMTKYQNDYKKGYNYGAEATYFLNYGYSLGIKYNAIKNSGSCYGDVSVNGENHHGLISDDSTISFVGLVFGSSTALAGSRSVFNANIGFGYVGYKDYAWVVVPFTLTGSTAGMYYGLQYDYKITKSIAVGAELAYYSGSINKVERSTNTSGTETISLEKDKAISVSHLDLSFGIRFYL